MDEINIKAEKTEKLYERKEFVHSSTKDDLLAMFLFMVFVSIIFFITIAYYGFEKWLDRAYPQKEPQKKEQQHD